VATLKPGQTIVTDQPDLAVDAGLPVGTYRFRLVVEDESRNRSDPAEVDVVVFQRTVTVLDPPIFVGPAIPVGPPIVRPGGPVATPIIPPRPII
jgi:hypothetical protein